MTEQSSTTTTPADVVTDPPPGSSERPSPEGVPTRHGRTVRDGHEGTPTSRAVLADHPDIDEPRRYLNRELTWLSFNERVLALAERDDLPLLERVKFLAIFTTNFDEFFQVRVAGLMDQVAAGRSTPPPDGMSPSQQLTAIRAYAGELAERQTTIFHDQVSPALDAEGIRYSDWSSLDDDDRRYLVSAFEERVFPVLTPLAVDPVHPFPYISNLSLNLAVVVRNPSDHTTHFARVKVPPILPRFVVMPDGERFVPLEQVIAAHLDRLFPGHEIVDHHLFRVTRNADLEVEEDEADDLMMAIESELTRRRFGRVVRLEIEPSIPGDILNLLMREMDIADEQVDKIRGPLGLDGLMSLYDLERSDLKYKPYKTAVPPALGKSATGSIFSCIRRGDILVHHPYDSFSRTVQRFVETAARDPHVLAIKMTLYRTSPDSPIVNALIKAAEAGKQVVALVELKARFDEERNIEWARTLEEVGVHVTYGVAGLKTHTKIAMVVRQEHGRVVRYAHVGTGNYNDKTARIYEDVGLLTNDAAVGADLTELFNVMTGYGRQRSYRRLVTAPTTFRSEILRLIRRESRAERGRIVLKMNSLVDAEMIDALYEASQAGTPVDLVVRGICCLRAGVPGLSDNIRVRSLVGRYLEHSRIYAFGVPGDNVDVLIGSGDLMPRNLNRRIEALIPIREAALKTQLLDLLDLVLADDVLAWEQFPDGSWSRVPTVDGINAQERLQELAHTRAADD
ncbi:polyphosphate kinase 1 [Salsipaludibacter albus]|uniref:polyphosphate kinase 1 n=1 Tax=Salsipaludibacter albus TaxID=2849650 RepID=UPI001EE41E93|nr:polyphosphate kinase 1 [Salsipaludibacter albus]MBY5163325.1 polyphosphate kinase 1 [Salsipaludibacter albus]